MRKKIRAPWSAPSFPWGFEFFKRGVLWDWIIYWYGMMRYGVGCRERGLLIEAISAACSHQVGIFIGLWSILYDGEGWGSVNGRELVQIPIRVSEEIGIILGVAKGYNVPNSLTVLFRLGFHEQAESVMKIAQVHVNTMRFERLGPYAKDVELSRQHASEAEFLINIPSSVLLGLDGNGIDRSGPKKPTT